MAAKCQRYALASRPEGFVPQPPGRDRHAIVHIKREKIDSSILVGSVYLRSGRKLVVSTRVVEILSVAPPRLGLGAERRFAVARRDSGRRFVLSSWRSAARSSASSVVLGAIVGDHRRGVNTCMAAEWQRYALPSQREGFVPQPPRCDRHAIVHP